MGVLTGGIREIDPLPQLLYYFLEQEAKYSEVVPNTNIVDVPGEKTKKKSSPIPGIPVGSN